MPRYTVDRFEGSEWAVLEDDTRRTFNVPREWLPRDTQEGDLLDASSVEAAGALLLRLTFDTDGRDERLTKAAQRRARLTQAPEGDIKL